MFIKIRIFRRVVEYKDFIDGVEIFYFKGLGEIGNVFIIIYFYGRFFRISVGRWEVARGGCIEVRFISY